MLPKYHATQLSLESCCPSPLQSGGRKKAAPCGNPTEHSAEFWRPSSLQTVRCHIIISPSQSLETRVSSCRVFMGSSQTGTLARVRKAQLIIKCAKTVPSSAGPCPSCLDMVSESTSPPLVRDPWVSQSSLVRATVPWELEFAVQRQSGHQYLFPVTPRRHRAHGAS